MSSNSTIENSLTLDSLDMNSLPRRVHKSGQNEFDFQFCRDGILTKVEECTRLGYDLNVQDACLYSPLHIAILWNHPQLVSHLANSAGIQLEIRDQFLMTPFLFAVHLEREECMGILIQAGVDLDARDRCNRSALNIAVQLQSQNLIKMLIRRSGGISLANISGNLLRCMHFGNSEGFELHAKTGCVIKELENSDMYVKVGVRGGCGRRSVRDGNSPISLAVQLGDLSTVVQLIQAGLDLKLPCDARQSNPIHLAIKFDRREILNCLIENGIDVNYFRRSQCPPLHSAMYCMNIECMVILLQNGANPNIRDSVGRHPLHTAMVFGKVEMIRTILLYLNGGSVNVQDFEGNTPWQRTLSTAVGFECFKILLQSGADINMQNREGNTLCHHMSRCQDLDGLRLLLNYGGMVNIQNKDGNTPLHILYDWFHDGSLGSEIAFLLLKNGALLLSLQNSIGQTAYECFKCLPETRHSDRVRRIHLHIVLLFIIKCVGQQREIHIPREIVRLLFSML